MRYLREKKIFEKKEEIIEKNKISFSDKFMFKKKMIYTHTHTNTHKENYK